MRSAPFAVLVLAVSACAHDARDPLDPRMSRESLESGGGPRYTITYLNTLDGSRNRPSGINNRGWVAGFVNRPGNTTRVAVLWGKGGVLDTLGTLGGPNSIVQWPGISNSGGIAGIAETNDPDPNNESWSCSAFLPTVTRKICLGFFWDDGVMTPLPTLGGNNGFAAGINSWGQVVGWAETPVHDPTCNAPQVLQFRAVLWEPKRGRKRELAPLPGDSTSAATAINEWGQAVGISGDCDIAVGQLSARHAVLWEWGKVIEIGDLGGDAWHTPMDINELGDVVGFSNPEGVPGITFAPHAFLWTRRGGIRDLGALPGDAVSQAVGINNWGQIVGVSSGAVNRAFLYERGVMKNLIDLVEPGFPDQLIVAQHINDAGVIVGRAVRAGSTAQVPFVATPIRH
jgi:probable HAF family extracellular repeat protein